MEKIKQLYEEYVKSYDALDISSKKNELLKKVLELNSNLSELTDLLGKKQNELTGKIDVSNMQELSDDEFFTTMFVYMHVLELQIGNLLNQLIKNK